MPLVPDTANMNYNGFQFPVDTTTEIEGVPVLDDARRTVKYMRWRIRAEFRVHGILTYIPGVGVSAQTDPTLSKLRQLLTKQGAALQYQNKGFGDMAINASGPKIDATWGPIVTQFNFKSVGGAQSCKVTWACEVNIPECDNAAYTGAFAAVNFSVTYSIDEDGYSSRQIQGTAEIPMTRNSVGDPSLSDDVDQYWEQIYQDIPFGFRRVQNRRSVDESKRVLRFSLIDEEISPQSLQIGVTKCSASHFIENTGNSVFGLYVNTISATYTMSKGYSRSDAINRFFDLVSSRLVASVQNGAVAIIPVHISLGEPDIFGRASGQFTYSWTSTVSLANLLSADGSGLWTPVPNSDWQIWRTSLSDVMGPRGNAGLASLPSDDVIISLCERNQLNLNKVSTLRPLGLPGTNGIQIPMRAAGPTDNYLRAEIFFAPDVKSETHVLKTLPLNQLTAYPSSPQPGFFGGIGDANIFTSVPGINNFTSSDVVQNRATPEIRFWYYGRALRAGQPVAIPPVVSLGGDAPVILDTKVAGGQVANFGVPIFGATWAQRLALPSPNMSLGIPENPQPGMSANLSTPSPTFPNITLTGDPGAQLAFWGWLIDFILNPDNFG